MARRFKDYYQDHRSAAFEAIAEDNTDEKSVEDVAAAIVASDSNNTDSES